MSGINKIVQEAKTVFLEQQRKVYGVDKTAIMTTELALMGIHAQMSGINFELQILREHLLSQPKTDESEKYGLNHTKLF